MSFPTQRQALIRVFLERNNRINLSAIRTAEGVYIKHILDSLELTKVLSLTAGSTLLDVGTGGGFPLLPLAMQFPEVMCSGIDGRRKKLDAIDEMSKELHLKNVHTIRGRIEEHEQQYDYVTARAVAYSDILLPELVRVTKAGGYIILYKLLTPEEDELIHDLARSYQLSLQNRHLYILEKDSQADPTEHEIQRVIYIFKK